MRAANVLKKLAAVAAVAAASLSEEAPATPRAGVMVGYALSGGSGTSTPNPDGTITIGQSGGRRETFALFLRSARRGEPRIFEAFKPSGYDRYDLHVRNVAVQTPGSEEGRLWQQQEALIAAVTYHRPALSLLLTRPGTIEVRRSAALRRYDRCARSLIDASWAHVPREEHAAGRRRHILNTALPDGRLPTLFLRLLMLQLPAASNTSWSEFERSQAENPDRDERPTQYRWRSEQIRLAGREVGLSVDLLRDRRSPAARACLSIEPADIGPRTSDRCRIEGMIDGRDGWPIGIGVSRRAEAANGATAGTHTSFLRLAPLEGFVPPENPCPA